jgi:hypothetical protein
MAEFGNTYRSADGTVIKLVTPWDGFGSGIIPPPAIQFYRDGSYWVFAYAGPIENDDDDDAAVPDA